MPQYALYARQSLEKKDSMSIENQLDFCRYETKGEPYQVYIDRGYSGKNTKRPGFEQMMQDVRAGHIKAIVVYKLDRISRSILDFSNMMELFQSYQVAFISSTEKFDTTTPIGRAMLSICITFAQLERETIQKRISDAYLAKSRKGFYMGGQIPYGYSLKKATIKGLSRSVFLPEPEEAQQVKQIYSLYAQGCSTPEIISLFQQQQINKKRGAPFRSSRISEILHNPVYVKAHEGVYDYLVGQGYQVINSRQEFVRDQAVFLYRQDNHKTAVLAPHQGFIDPDIWLACQQTNHTSKHSTWLKSRIRCAKCGCFYIPCGASKSHGYLCCSGKDKKGCSGTEGPLYADLVEQALWKAMTDHLKQLAPGQKPEQKKWTPQSRRQLLDLMVSDMELMGNVLTVSFKIPVKREEPARIEIPPAYYEKNII